MERSLRDAITRAVRTTIGTRFVSCLKGAHDLVGTGHLTESTYIRYAISSQMDMEAGVVKIAALRAARAKRTG